MLVKVKREIIRMDRPTIRPEGGVLYPGLLSIGQQFVVEYSTQDPQIARVAGRTAGAVATPLVMLHASPGSAKQLEGLIAPLAAHRRVVALDTRGNGDSTPLPIDSPTIHDFAAATIEALDALDLGRCDLYGTHTGASIAMEVALAQPQRVRRLVLDEAVVERRLRAPEAHTVAYAVPNGVDPGGLRVAMKLGGFTSIVAMRGMHECLVVECEAGDRDRVRQLIAQAHETESDGAGLDVRPRVVFEDER